MRKKNFQFVFSCAGSMGKRPALIPGFAVSSFQTQFILHRLAVSRQTSHLFSSPKHDAKR